ncbi:MAG: succinate--CoA ligase subunit beta, partial [Candidatus Helarchaeota archaeon]|nr:succinate--CoA ligase subunit beta [Candidatus Helarchaeota archaeon]
KAQVLVGGRGKSGGIKGADTPKEALSIANTLFKTKIKDQEVKSLLIEKKIDIQNEIYIGITVDRLNHNFIIIFSASGGVEIEELAKTDPEKIIRMNFKSYEFDDLDLKRYLKAINYSQEIISQIDKLLHQLWRIMNDYDLDLIEINPCILSKDGKLYAADARVNVDDNSIFRHEEFIARTKEGLTQSEIQVKEKGMSYVELDGDIGIICNGAGLVMSTIDTVRHYGGTPANFLDIGGGATRERILFALKVISSNPRIKGILINIVGGITRCDEIAHGIIEFLKSKKEISMSIRLVGTREEEGKELLAQHGIPMLETMEEAIKKIIELVS